MTAEQPDSTAARVALWRALHVELDAPPRVLDDVVGLQLAAPDAGWRDRGDMHPQGTATFRASMVARARYVEDLVVARAAEGVRQYVLLGAGLDTFAQRRPDIASTMHVFEVDQPGPQAWKRARLEAEGFGVPDHLHLVPVDFEVDDWWTRLADADFDPRERAVVASTGVSMYLTKEANRVTLQQLASLAPGSSVVVSFLVPRELLPADEQPGLEMAEAGARASGTPFLSFFTPAEIVDLARDAGFPDVEHVGGDALNARYFAGRSDHLRTSNGEQLIVAST